MKKCIPFILFIALLTPGCQLLDKANAREYNDKIVEEQSKIVTVILDCIEKYNAGDIAGASSMLEPIRVQCDSSISVIEKIGPFKDNDKMQQKALALFHFYKHDFIIDYQFVFDVMSNANATPEDLDKAQNALDNFSVKEKKFVHEFKDAQKEFIVDNNLSLSDNPVNDRIHKMKD